MRYKIDTVGTRYWWSGGATHPSKTLTPTTTAGRESRVGSRDRSLDRSRSHHTSPRGRSSRGATTRPDPSDADRLRLGLPLSPGRACVKTTNIFSNISQLNRSLFALRARAEMSCISARQSCSGHSATHARAPRACRRFFLESLKQQVQAC